MVVGRAAIGRAVLGGAAAAAILGGVLSPPGAAALGEARTAAALEAPGTADAAPRWQWPVHPSRVVQAFAAPPSPYAAGHRGIDLAAEPGQTVVSPSDATVHFSGVVVDRPVVTLDHGSGILSSYEPLIADGLREGDTVARGARLGIIGTGAHCAGACLHVGVRVDGAYISPLLFFDRVPRSVLLPLHGRTAAAAQARG